MSYRSYTFEELQQITKKYSKIQVKSQKGAKLLFVDQGARLLGLFPDPSLPNVLWVNEFLERAYRRGSWLVGGERLWVSPERNYYYENPRDFSGVHVPVCIDPGFYKRGKGLSWSNRFSLLDLWHNEPVDDTILTRTMALQSDPYKSGLSYAGVTINEHVSIPATDVTLALWSLAQTYTCGKEKPGTALFPVKKGAKLISYFKPIPPSFAGVKAGYARFKLDSSRIFKLAIAPEDVVWENPCKDIYVSPYPKGSKWFLVAKRSDDLPKTQDECVDVSKSDPNGRKGAIQSYNNGPDPLVPGPLAEFGEIELQLTKATVKGKKQEASATHELLSYAGTKKQILELAGKMLGIKGVPEVY